ncbi:MAG: hypothetical protein J7647_27375 [Cyanobacteria bacterium SBLK]|nr:hypothetical protein [Cyanobacteria bacterium SBLK]
MIFIADRPDNPNFAVLKQAILSFSPQTSVRIISSEAVLPTTETIYPLTFNLPDSLEFSAKSVYQQCENVRELQQWVEKNLEYATGEGHYWLPIVLTAKGPLYAEAIAQNNETQTYEQPFHLADVLRQPLYHLAWELLSYLNAPPAVYTLQFDWQGEEIFFDRLFPFPHESTHISLGIQQPDLLTCHGLCLTQQPILDLTIVTQ